MAPQRAKSQSWWGQSGKEFGCSGETVGCILKSTVAERYCRSERQGHTLSPSALIHEP